MVRLLIVPALAIVGCERREVLPYGPTQYTPAGYPVVLPTSYERPDMSDAEVMRVVEYRVAQWIREKAKWGLAEFSDEMLEKAARGVPIVVFDSYTTPYFGYGGANIYGEWIEIALYHDADPIPMTYLPHELTHSILLDYHEH